MPTYSLYLDSADPVSQKIQAIKVIREASGLGLKEAKDVSEALGNGKAFFSTDDKARAEQIRKELAALGYHAHISPNPYEEDEDILSSHIKTEYERARDWYNSLSAVQQLYVRVLATRHDSIGKEIKPILQTKHLDIDP